MADSFKSAQGSSKSVQRIKVTKTIQKTLPNVRCRVGFEKWGDIAPIKDGVS